MTSAETHAANTLKEIRRSVIADSTLFGERLKPETAMSDTAGYSDLFMEACCDSMDRSSDGVDDRESGSARGAADNSDSGETKVLETVRLGLEYIFEGYLLHYSESRLLGQTDDSNFNLLAGDYMYARGLEAIATLEDLASIEALAELVRLCSYIHCEKLDPRLAAKAWAVTTIGLAVRTSSGGSVAFSGMPAFSEPEKLDDLLNELMDTASRREISSNIEAEFFHGN